MNEFLVWIRFHDITSAQYIYNIPSVYAYIYIYSTYFNTYIQLEDRYRWTTWSSCNELNTS